jgi:hypothetical protein
MFTVGAIYDALQHLETEILVSSLTLLCMVMTCNTFETEENDEHHFDFTAHVACFIHSWQG